MVPLTADNGSIGCAIRFSDDGAYLFVSSRLGYQSITAYRCGDDGLLHFCSRCSCGGITPRDFNVFADVSGTGQQGGSDKSDHPDDYILVANQDSDLITALRFTRADESLALLDMEMQVDKPTCILPVL
jgi:6-phosphogluconolactonase (cycloisomerase 2 family)